MDVLKKIPHRHFVFSIPKILRRYFLYDRKLLTKARPPPKAHAPWGHDAGSSPHECAAGDLQLQAHADTIYGDPEYSWDAYIISMHNASSKKACRRGLSEICPQMPPCRLTRPKCGMISQKSGHRSIFLTLSHRQPLLFDV